MSLDPHSEARLQPLYPRLASTIRQLAMMLEQEGITICVVQGLRTIAEQQSLYEQGRSTPGRIVTNAPGGHSWHNFGLAVDCAIKNLDGSIDWDASHPAWHRMESVGVSLGLTSGANWVRIVDAPHFQITGRFPEGAPNDEARAIAASESGLAALWAEVDKSYT